MEKTERTNLSDTYTRVDAGYVDSKSFGEFKFSFIMDGKRYAFRCTPDELETIHVYNHESIPLVKFALEGGTLDNSNVE
jgi:membrane-bound inhibitor of C-type lysozyme